jgi:hypothetical protein
MEDPRDLSPQ